MVASRHIGASLGAQREVAVGHRSEIPLSCGVAPSLRALIRQLVAEARSGPCICADANNYRNGEVIIDAVVDGFHCLLTSSERSPSSQIAFSPRESEIAYMVAKGYPNKRIEGVLKISSWTVGTHLRRMFAKLGVSSRAAMVARMMDIGVPERPRRKNI
jgi:DNA-binding CsgD family transcriptional regulator